MDLSPPLAFQSKAVRDLAWTISSPALMAHPLAIDDSVCQQFYREMLPQLKELDTSGRLEQFLSEKVTNQRLGSYFETLIEYWIAKSAGLALVEKNLQVCEETGKTVGEFDFLLKDTRTNTYYHWEAAVKYYLQHPVSAKWEHWIGPNHKDNLALKWHRLTERQVWRSKQRAAQQLLKSRETQSVQPRIFIKGWFFYHCKNWGHKLLPPQSANPVHLKGLWCYQSEMSEVIRRANGRWKMLHCLEWLSPEIETTNNRLMSGAEMEDFLNDYFQKNPNPRCWSI